jgi:cytochrome c556
MTSFPFLRFSPSAALIATLVSVFLLASLTGCAEPEDPRPDQPVRHRREAFKALLRDFESLGLQLRSASNDFPKMALITQKMDQAKQTPWPYFLPDTLYPPSRATESVWSMPERFAQEKNAFVHAITQLHEAALHKDQAALKRAYDQLHQRCEGCHKIFKR